MGQIILPLPDKIIWHRFLSTVLEEISDHRIKNVIFTLYYAGQIILMLMLKLQTDPKRF